MIAVNINRTLLHTFDDVCQVVKLDGRYPLKQLGHYLQHAVFKLAGKALKLVLQAKSVSTLIEHLQLCHQTFGIPNSTMVIESKTPSDDVGDAMVFIVQSRIHVLQSLCYLIL